MELFRMTDIIPLLGIQDPPANRGSYNIPCICCDEKPRDRHMNINIRKDVFRCARCGVSGGVFALYSLYTGVPQDRVRKELVNRIGRPTIVSPQKRKPIQVDLPAECPLTDVETRHNTYTVLLSKLSLAGDHKENLLNRGLTEEEIRVLGYKTSPVVGHTALAKQLQSEGYYLAGVPGFFRNENGSWTLYHKYRGIYVPVRDMNGMIQGIQIRLDKADKRKFRWVTSRDMQDGCAALVWPHIAGPVRPVMLLTEGPMKADIIHRMTGLSVIAVPGVDSLTQLAEALNDLRAAGLREIKTAFDMDYSKNHNVTKSYAKLTALLESMGFLYGTYIWDPRFKGLDEYIWEYCFQRERPI